MLAAARNVARENLGLDGPAHVLLCHPPWSAPFFEALEEVLVADGHVTVRCPWTPAQLGEQVARGHVEEAVRWWFPERTAGRWRLGDGRLVDADRVVTVSPPLEGPGVAAGELGAVEACGWEKLTELGDARNLVVMVEWPPPGPRVVGTQRWSHEALCELFARALMGPAEPIRGLNEVLCQRLRGSRSLHIRCPFGSDLTVRVEGRRWFAEDTVAGGRQGPVQLPGGEVYVACIEDSAEGRLVFADGDCLWRLEVHAGLPVDLAPVRADAGSAAAMSAQLRLGTEPVCEVGIGTNPRVPPQSIGALTEKARGTLHVAVGTNVHFGGQHSGAIHQDLMVLSPDLDADGRPVLRRGSLVP